MKYKVNIYLVFLLFVFAASSCMAKNGLFLIHNRARGIDFIYNFFNRDCNEIINEIESYEGDINSWFIGESNVLVLSAKFAAPEILKAILKKGGNAKLETFGSENPFDAAISHARVENVKILYNASINSISDNVKLLEESFDEYIMSLSIIYLYRHNMKAKNEEELALKNELKRNKLLFEIISFFSDKNIFNSKQIEQLHNYFLERSSVLLLGNKKLVKEQEIIKEWNNIYKCLKK